MSEGIKRIGSRAGLHMRRQAVGYVALVVALGGSAYAGTKAGSSKVGGRDLKPFVERGGTQVTVPPGAEGESRVMCKRGERALVWLPRGRLFVTGVVPEGPVKEGSARFRPKGYRVTARNESSTPFIFSANALCLRP